ncbi:MAG: DEAD/DEAH box helicase [Verrucomicrobia bacterium]|jgi:superfamily II DNA/RNA helicase|nr:DEAD/DEAH box helicase [Verrucomicrobiota bacterium]
MSFEKLNLDERLLKAVEACGFETPTPIQAKAIPIILEGGDVMGSAQTGTGKTAAFVLPILHQLITRKPVKKSVGPRCLVVAPTRELAQQVEKDATAFSKFIKFTQGSVVGGVSYGPQLQILKRPLDLLIATPGRLLDHMGQGRIDFSRLEFLVLDEADRMLDMGFIGDIRKIVAAVPEKRQTLLFSATLEGPVLRMAQTILKDPESIQLTTNQKSHDQIDQRIHWADDVSHKHNLLAHYVQTEDVSQAVIFTSTKRGADELVLQLNRKGQQAAVLHGDLRMTARKKTMDEMHHGKIKLLVATDIAARGLDFKNISHVFNFDLPNTAEDYIHRIGRTGRASACGTAISLVCRKDWDYLVSIERLTGSKLKRDLIPGLEPRSKEPKTRSTLGNAGRSWKPRRRGVPRRRVR